MSRYTIKNKFFTISYGYDNTCGYFYQLYPNNPANNIELSPIIREGYNVGIDKEENIELDVDCPYTKGTINRQLWIDGYMLATCDRPIIDLDQSIFSKSNFQAKDLVALLENHINNGFLINKTHINMLKCGIKI